MSDTTRRRDAPTLIAESFIVVTGVWQLLFTLAVRLGLSFSTLALLSPLCVLLSVGILWTRPNTAPHEAHAPSQVLPASSATLALVAVLAAGWHFAWVPWPVLWLALLGHGALLARGTSATAVLDTRGGPIHSGLLALACALGALATLWIHRPEGDDGYYLAQVVYTVANPDRALLSFDVLHGDLSLPIQQVAHRAQGFETLVSMLVHLSGLGAHDVYYIYLPVMFSAGGIIATWVLARALLGPRAATVAALALVALLPLWGGHHFSYGNYGFARMFQGKAVAVTVMIPLTIWAGLRYTEDQSPRAWLMLALAQAGAAMATSTALVVAPLAAALAVLPGVTPDRRGARLAAGGLLSALPIVVMLILVKLEITTTTQMEATGSLKTLSEALGETGYTPLAVIAWAALPLIARRGALPGGSWLSRYVPIATLLLLNGVVTVLIANRLGDLYSWRLFWAIPFPAVMALTLGALAELAWSKRGAWAGALAIALTLVAMTSTRSWIAENGANLRFAEWKVPLREGLVADAILDATSPDDLVLAPAAVTVRLTPYVDRPTLLVVRRGYLKHLERELGPEEVESRVRLFAWANEGLTPEDTPWALNELDRRCVSVTVTLKSLHEALPGLDAELQSRGFSELLRKNRKGKSPLPGKYKVWTRPPCP